MPDDQQPTTQAGEGSGETPPHSTPRAEAPPAEEPFDRDRAMATIKAQREREATDERERKALAKKLADAEARLKEHEDEKLSEQERAAKRLAEVEAEAARLKAERQALLVRHAVEREAARLGFADPEDAYRFVDVTALTVDDAGQPQGVKKQLETLLEAKPYLKGAGNGATSGVPATPRANGPLSHDDAVQQAMKDLQKTRSREFF